MDTDIWWIWISWCGYRDSGGGGGAGGYGAPGPGLEVLVVEQMVALDILTVFLDLLWYMLEEVLVFTVKAVETMVVESYQQRWWWKFWSEWR